MGDYDFRGKKALVLGASKWQVPLIAQAQSMGLEVIATDYNPKAVGFKVADHGEVVDILDVKANIEVGIRYGIDAVMTDQTDYALNVVAAVASNMVIPGPSLQVAKNCTNKKLMRQLTDRVGVDNPRFYIAQDLQKARLAASDLGFPLVIKPTDNQGSRGVFKIDSMKQLVELFSDSIRHSRDGEILLEEYINGTEVTVEGFVADGILHVLAISEKKHTPPPRIIAMNLDFPPRYSESLMKKIKHTASMTAKSLGMRNGPFHGEFIVNEKGIYLVEAAHRGGGSGTSSHIVPAVSGVNMLEKLVLVSLGEKVEIRPTRNDACTLKFLEYEPGMISRIDGLKEARNIPGINLFEINYSPGEIIPEVTDDSKRHGAVIASGPTAADTHRLIDLAMRKVKVHYTGRVETRLRSSMREEIQV